MGKVKVKVIGDEQQEEAQKQEESVKREQKALRQAQGSDKKSAKVPNMKGGERTTSVGVTEEEIMAEVENATQETTDGKSKKGKGKKEKKHVVSKRHTDNKKLAPKDAQSLLKSIEQLRGFKKSSFDETVELHINTKEKGVSGTVTLPHGTGKTLRIKIADDATLLNVEKGKIDFDILVATPAMMPKLAKVARVLGPRGLMPNPKNGTITDKPEEAVKKLSAGQISFKTESQAPIIHMSVGKLSFDDKALTDNITTAITAIGNAKIEKVILKSTMSPAVRIKVASK